MPGGRIAGILFLQGEEESVSDARARSWLPDFKRLLAAFRADLGAKVPLLLGQTPSLDPDNFPDQRLVRDEEARVTTTTPRVRLVRTVDLPTTGLHFSVGSYRIVGTRFAEAWWRMTHRR